MGKAGTSPKCYNSVNKLQCADPMCAVVRNVAIMGKFTLMELVKFLQFNDGVTIFSLYYIGKI